MTIPFGHSALSLWHLDPDITYLNHGTVGATPKRVLEVQQRFRDEIERQPARFLLRELAGEAGRYDLPEPRLRTAARAVAEFLGAAAQDLVFVENATAGVNAVVRSFDFREGDEILVPDLGYGGVVRAISLVARECGAVVVPVTLPFPPASDDPSPYVDAYLNAVTPRTRMALVDHITSETALILPLREITAALQAQGVAVLVDAAHAPGSIPVDIKSYGADWYTANLHKWAFAPRASAILWAAPERQAGLRPAITSWGLDAGFPREFDWAATHDPTNALAAPEGITFLRDLGGQNVYGHNHALIWHAGHELTKRWGGTISTPESWIGCMMAIPLPLSLGSTRPEAQALRDALLYEDRIEVAPFPHGGRLYIRISAQIYNEMSDLERLGAAIDARCG